MRIRWTGNCRVLITFPSSNKSHVVFIEQVQIKVALKGNCCVWLSVTPQPQPLPYMCLDGASHAVKPVLTSRQASVLWQIVENMVPGVVPRLDACAVDPASPSEVECLRILV